MSLSNDGSLLAIAKYGDNSGRRHHRPVDLFDFDDRIPERKSDDEGQSSPVLTNCRQRDDNLRLPGRGGQANTEELSDSKYSDDQNVVQGEEIQADEGDHSPFPAKENNLADM